MQGYIKRLSFFHLGQATYPSEVLFSVLYQELELYLDNVRNITNKIKIDKENVTNDTLADIAKTQDELVRASNKALDVHILVGHFHIFRLFDNLIFSTG